ncbi:hypothetical protein ACJX0J_022515, partial [Zea mays]
VSSIPQCVVATDSLVIGFTYIDIYYNSKQIPHVASNAKMKKDGAAISILEGVTQLIILGFAQSKKKESLDERLDNGNIEIWW